MLIVNASGTRHKRRTLRSHIKIKMSFRDYLELVVDIDYDTLGNCTWGETNNSNLKRRNRKRNKNTHLDFGSFIKVNSSLHFPLVGKGIIFNI